MQTQVAYTVCGVQRCGSSLLCKGIAATGLAGDPQEYFWNWRCAVNDGWSPASYVHWAETPWAREARLDGFAEFAAALARHKTGANGVFGMQLMAGYLDELFATLRRLPGTPGASERELVERWLPRTRYVRLVRRDTLRQAISWAIAAQTGVYNSTWPHAPSAEPHYDPELIADRHRAVLAGERRWDAFFARHGVEPLVLVYEDLARDYAGTLRRLLDFLGVAQPPGFAPAAPLERQATGRNDDWAARYRSRDGAGAATAEPAG